MWETYEYTSTFLSGLFGMRRTQGHGATTSRSTDAGVRIPSSSIGIVTTKDLSGSVISRFPIINIPVGSPKVSNRYSVLIKQRVIGLDEYTYLGILKKTTENLGGLFSAQPGTVRGNIPRSGSINKVVLGFFSASEISQNGFSFVTRNSQNPLQIRPPCKM